MSAARCLRQFANSLVLVARAEIFRIAWLTSYDSSQTVWCGGLCSDRLHSPPHLNVRAATGGEKVGPLYSHYLEQTIEGNFMPQTPHVEQHFTAGETIRDIVIGMSDGLTVPFALAAGLSGAVSSTHIVVTAGLAEIAAGSIAMGLGGYLAARSDAEHYASERIREQQEIKDMAEAEKAEVMEV